MCGIVGYTGQDLAAPILLDGLTKLEYRGYDSAGIAVREDDHDPVLIKTNERLKALKDKTDNGLAVPGTCGIGHTRWATHGAPSERNAHPHHSDDCNVIGVHNGIIENFAELKQKLEKNNYTFYSDTDTEVAVKLIDYYYKKYKMGPIDALAKSMVRIRGSYALAVMFRDYPGQIFVARKDSPMVIGITDEGAYVASDVPAILKYTRNVYYIDNLEMAKLSGGTATFYDLNGDEVEKETTEIKWDAEAAERGGFEHFMMKEIHEQPKAIMDTLRSLLTEKADSRSGKSYTLDFAANVTDEQPVTDQLLKDASHIYIVACGSAYHVGFIAKYIIEDMAEVEVTVDLASEFRYRKLLLDPKGLVIVISQSGETMDTLEAMRLAKKHGLKTLAMVNVMGSSIAREADYVVYTKAGPEIAVATTKAYSAQLILIYILAIRLAQVKGKMSDHEADSLYDELFAIPGKIEKILEDKERIQWFASKYSNAQNIFFLGRGLDYAISMEGSLKMKEISYIHSESYAAGELKHGTISLIEKGILCIGVCTQMNLYEK
ncbi:MAG: glutamine--fructose-6-phosphate transaminase (isomerizing), partial [Lachnospiraceae bacterium]